MLRTLFILTNILFTLILNVIFGEGVKVTQNFPAYAEPGSEFEVEITLNKTDVTGFAKIQQDFPAGFTAEAIETQGASFTFNDNILKLIWISLPEQEEIKLKYKVKVDASVKGTFDVGGKFSYLYNNERKIVDMPVSKVQIGKTAEEIAAASQPEKVITASVDREVSQLSADEFEVKLTVKQSGIEGFAKIQEELPSGVTGSTAGETKKSVFSFVDNKAKFVWMSFPAEGDFVINYTVKGQTTVDELAAAVGNLSYLKNEETVKVPVTGKPSVQTQAKTEVPVVADNSAALKEAEEKRKAEELAQQEALKKQEADKAAAEAAAQQNAAQQDAEKARLAQQEADRKAKEEAEAKRLAEENKRKQEEQNRIAAEQQAKAKTEEEAKASAVANASASASNVTSVPAPQNGLTYKVQICAGHKPVPVDSHFKEVYKYSESAIAVETHEGWIKYTIGGYSGYKDAKDKRNEVTSNYTFPGPFVTAYNGGQRITVQEALMISNQKWVK